MITADPKSRTSAQIALEDSTFHELFGMVWSNDGYILKSSQDLSWAILYKDMFLQGLSDYANEGFIKFFGKDNTAVERRKAFTHESAKDWVENDSPFNNVESIKEFKVQIVKTIQEFYATKSDSVQVASFKRKLDRARVILAEGDDPFSFNKCCEVLGLESEVARARFMLYRQLKLKHGDKIRIVTYTGTTKNVNIPSLDDIIKAEEADGEYDLTLFLHIGVKRKLRNSALVRSKNERSDQRNSQ